MPAAELSDRRLARMKHQTKLFGFFLASLLILQFALDAQAAKNLGSIVGANRGILATTPACQKVSDKLRNTAKVASSKPMCNLPLTFPVFSLDPKLGELADSCVYSIPVEKWRKESSVPDSYIEAAEKLADIAAFNAAIAGCQIERDAALGLWRDLVLKWIAARGFTGPNSTWSGVFMSHKALAATAAGFMKVRPLLTSVAKETISGYLKVWDAYTAAIPLVISNKVFRETALGEHIVAQYTNGTAVVTRPFSDDPDGGTYNNHEVWKQAARLMANLAVKNYAEAKKRLDASITQMSLQVKKGYIIREKRCYRTVHYHIYYLEAGLVQLATWKLANKPLPSTVVPVLPQINKVLLNLESPNASAIFAGFFGYSKKVVAGQIPWSGLSRLRRLYQFVKTPAQKTLGVRDQDCRFVGFLENLKF